MPVRDEMKPMYARDFARVKAEAMERAGGRCQRCGRADKATHVVGVDGRWRDAAGGGWRTDRGAPATAPDPSKTHTTRTVLTLAHLDQDPANDDPANLAILCQRCHLAHDRAAQQRARRDHALLKARYRPATDNSPEMIPSKADMRRRLLTAVRPARVLDCCAGVEGVMHREAWHAADAYLGIDLGWRQWDPRPRMVCDNRVALRTLDLAAWNVFDVDTYGHPWEQLIILAARRRWARGEVGGVAATIPLSGGWGGTSAALAELLGQPAICMHGMSLAVVEEAAMAGVRAFLARAGVRATRQWKAGRASGTGKQAMLYTALVFEGKGE